MRNLVENLVKDDENEVVEKFQNWKLKGDRATMKPDASSDKKGITTESESLGDTVQVKNEKDEDSW